MGLCEGTLQTVLFACVIAKGSTFMAKSKITSRTWEIITTVTHPENLDEWQGGLPQGIAISENAGIIKTRADDMLVNKNSSASLLYISEKDELYNNAKQIEPIDGYEDIIIHADKHNFYLYNMQGDEFTFTAAEMARMLRQSKGYHGGKIRLIACESAAEGGTVAQELANALGVEILAPSGIVWVDPNGKMTIGQLSNVNTGSWIKIKPKKG